MPQFMDVHTGMTGLTAQQLKEAHEHDKAIEGDAGVHFLKAWADPVTGKVFCLSEGPNKAAVLDVHRRAGHPTDEIYEVPLSVD
ncbi:MAG: SCO4226 family nickel-binding protein [Deltaproteobacteria bacterium]|nr:SCO4226 family nickel-binding protein [Deltaproteobacteria bacterium]